MNDKRLSIILTIVCAVLMAIATVYATVTAAGSVPEGVPPEVNTEGLCVYEPVYEMYYTQEDVIAVAKMLYGESQCWAVAENIGKHGMSIEQIQHYARPTLCNGDERVCEFLKFGVKEKKL